MAGVNTMGAGSRSGIALAALSVVLAVSACGAPREPDLGYPDLPLIEVFRVTSPVPAPAPGANGWHLFDGVSGLIGEGTRLARLDLDTGETEWSRTLQPEYALTARPGQAHSAMSHTWGHVVLLAGADGHAGPTKIQVIEGSGRTMWERALPPAAAPGVTNRVLPGGDESDPTIVVAHCEPDGCDLAGLAATTGKELWTVHTPEVVDLDSGFNIATEPFGRAPSVYLIDDTSVSKLDTIGGRLRWKIATEPGPRPRVVAGLYRDVLVTPPVAPDCQVTLRSIDDGAEVWRRVMPWYDAGAAAGSPCSYDPARPLRSGPTQQILVPRPGLAVFIDDYHGTHQTKNLAKDEYFVTGALTWNPETGYQDRGYRDYPLDTPPPADGRPWGLTFGSGWVLRTGTGWAVVDPDGARRQWTEPHATAVGLGRTPRLVYAIGDQLVGLGPQPIKGGADSPPL